MAISLADSVARPKLSQVVSVPVSVSILNPVETDGTDSFTQYVQLDNITPAAFTETCNGTNATSTLTVTSAPHTIRVGDAVTGTGVAASTTVTAVSGNTITISQNLTAGISGGTITFTPPETDAKLIGLQGTFTASGSTVTLRLRAYTANGSTVTGPTDSTTITSMGQPVSDVNIRVDLDTFLLNARVPRVN